jgi:hypothetical protein
MFFLIGKNQVLNESSFTAHGHGGQSWSGLTIYPSSADEIIPRFLLACEIEQVSAGE